MLQSKSYCANRFDELVNLKGEVIRGVLQHEGKIYIILESGFGFWFNHNGAFAIEHPDEIRLVIKAKKDRLNTIRHELELVLEMAGEKGVQG